MSVIRLSHKHISALALANFSFPINYYYDGETHSIRDNPQHIGDVLLNENNASYNARYSSKPQLPPEHVHLTYPETPFSAIEIVRLTKSYMYQACESPTWDNSEAKLIAESILDVAIFSLPGYKDALWTI